jgi:ubiquitin C-terminal hydrolase
VRYDSQLIPEVVAMHNSGVLCYFNSLIQSLLCLPAFNKFLVDRESEFLASGNVLGLSLLQIFREAHASSQKFPDRPSAYKLDTILKNLIAKRRHMGAVMQISVGQQEDAQEGYQMLLNSIIGNTADVNELEMIFHIRHDTIIQCKECKHKHIVTAANTGAPAEIFIDIPHSHPVIGILDTQEKVQKYINCFDNYPPDYKCEKCGARNGTDSNNVIQRYLLRRLSSVLVLVFKNYPTYVNRSIVRYFPSGMEFRSNTGMLLYQAVAKIEHFGTERSGHYMAVGQRRVHPAMHESHMERLRASNSSRRQLRSASRDTAIFQMNDTSIAYEPSGIVPTPNTYMVFYHLM